LIARLTASVPLPVKDDLDAVGAEGGGDALARLLEQALGLLARAVDRRRVADHGERGGERLDASGRIGVVAAWSR
jgi:hypothetical protein